MIIWLHIILLAIIKAVCRSIQGCVDRACIGICIWKQLFAVSWEASLFCKIRWGSSLLVRCQVCLLTFSKSDWKMGYCILKGDDVPVWCFDTCTRYVCFCFWMYPVCNTLSNQKSNRWACRPGIWPKDKILSRSPELATQLTVLYRY